MDQGGSSQTLGASPDGPVILLQGPMSGFFGPLARSLSRAHGIPVLKVQYNFADVVMDRAPRTVWFQGAVDDSPVWYRHLFTRERPRAVIGLGDQRPIHKAARDVCRTLGIPFLSFEEGYIRPDYVTLEPWGNNAASMLVGVDIPTEIGPLVQEPVRYGPNIAPCATTAIAYYILKTIGSPLFWRYRHHRDRPVLGEAWQWIRCYLRNKRYKRADVMASEQLAASRPGAFYVVGLQVYDDLQLRLHGRGWTPEALIAASIASFAAHAPTSTSLVIKQHPLDVGHQDYEELTRALAAAHGVGDRVIYWRYANQLDLLKSARGMVTVNSTLGLAALHTGCPVLALGDCLYARPGLASAGRSDSDLDQFWATPPAVDLDLARRFRQLLLHTSQINGDFYIRRAWPDMVTPIAAIIARVAANAAPDLASMTQAVSPAAPLVGGTPSAAEPAGIAAAARPA